MIFTILGWTGSILCLAGYYYVVRGGRIRILHWANLFGCLCFVAFTVYIHAWPSTVVDAVYSVVAAKALLQKDKDATYAGGAR